MDAGTGVGGLLISPGCQSDSPASRVSVSDRTIFWPEDVKLTNCSKPGNWGNELRVTTSSFNILNAPVARGHFLGD
jgi:hypothetical protein